MLQRLGYPYVRVGDGAQAIEMLKKQDFELVLMDCHMPVMNGYDATMEIRKLQGGFLTLPILALTASVIEADRRRYEQAGMSAFLGKPTVMTELEEVLAQQLT
jgi:CheY-like chemotaxis protein